MFLKIRRYLRPFSRQWYDFKKNKEGATAVEFGIIAIPFFALKFAIIETSLIFWSGQVLDAGVAETSRLIRTGQAQGTMSAADFRTRVCTEIGALFDCNTRLAVDVQTYATFDAADLNNLPVDSDGNYTGGTNWQPGVGGDIVVARAFYRWPVMFNISGFDMADIGGRQRLLSATAAFRNEPF